MCPVGWDLLQQPEPPSLLVEPARPIPRMSVSCSGGDPIQRGPDRKIWEEIRELCGLRSSERKSSVLPSNVIISASCAPLPASSCTGVCTEDEEVVRREWSSCTMEEGGERRVDEGWRVEEGGGGRRKQSAAQGSTGHATTDSIKLSSCVVPGENWRFRRPPAAASIVVRGGHEVELASFSDFSNSHGPSARNFEGLDTAKLWRGLRGVKAPDRDFVVEVFADDQVGFAVANEVVGLRWSGRCDGLHDFEI